MPALLRPDNEIVSDITCIISDVDGVLTDGSIVYTNDGVEIKRFHVRDGVAIKAWMASGFEFALLTARSSALVQRRADELGIQHVQQGRGEKLSAAKEMFAEMNCEPENVCYIGDDLPDIPVMKRVGLAVAPADACVDTRDAANWILRSCGGQGAVRELVERMLRAKMRWEEHVPS